MTLSKTLLGRAWARLALALSVATERRQLAALDDAMLHDLGISRAQARFEASRPAWDVPIESEGAPAARGRLPMNVAWR